MQEGNDHSFPDELDVLVNRRFIFKVEISMFNIRQGSKTYTVRKMSDNINMIKRFQSSSNISQVPFK